VDVLEGAHALGLRAGDVAEVQEGDGWRALRAAHTGHLVVSWSLAGYTTLDGSESGENLVHARAAVNTLRATLPGPTTFASLHYASPRPLPHAEVLRRGRALAAWAAGA
jgi:hypothetical protein